MKAITRLNEYLVHVPPQFMGISPLRAPELVEYFQVQHPATTHNALGMMLAMAATFGKTRIAYDIPGPMARQLFEADMMQCMNLPSEIVQFPHSRMFVMASDISGHAWEFFLTNSDETLTPGVRMLTITDTETVVVLFLRNGATIKECISESINYFGEIETFTEDTKIGFAHYALFAVKFSLFLMSTKDYKDEAIPPVGGGKRNRNKPDFMRNPGLNRVVGGKFQSALKIWEKKQRLESQGGTHASPKPHLRAGHFHLYHTGSGRTIPVVKFLHPCLVNADSVDEVDIQRTILV